jgi:hypothetical protein
LADKNLEQAKFMTSSIWTLQKIQEVRYKVAEFTVKTKNPHTAG